MVAVSAAALTAFGRRIDGSSFRDWAVEAFASAILMSDVDPSDLDALVVASESDFFTLQLNPASDIADDLGLSGVATTRVEGGGASGQLAVQAGVARILAGLARHVVVLGVDPTGSALLGTTVKDLYGFSFDTWTDGMTGVSSSVLYGLSFQDFAARSGATAVDLAAVTILKRANACENPGAHLRRRETGDEIDASPLIASPYRRLHGSPFSDGAAAGTDGDIVEIVTPGNAPTRLLGYRNNPGKKAELKLGPYLRTHDLAVRDADGYFWYKGRSDDLIKSSGFRIGPPEIEACLLSHPAVAECAVVGKPDADRGSIVKAFIKLRIGFEGSEGLTSDLADHVRTRLAAYKAPREFVFVDEFDMTSSGKINHRALREAEASGANADNAVRDMAIGQRGPET